MEKNKVYSSVNKVKPISALDFFIEYLAATLHSFIEPEKASFPMHREVVHFMVKFGPKRTFQSTKLFHRTILTRLYPAKLSNSMRKVEIFASCTRQCLFFDQIML